MGTRVERSWWVGPDHGCRRASRSLSDEDSPNDQTPCSVPWRRSCIDGHPGGLTMSEAIWNLGALSIGTGVLTVLASVGFAVYLVLAGPERRPQ
jgi:hypothetical protein